MSERSTSELRPPPLEKAYDTTWKYEIMKDLHGFGLKGGIPNFINSLLLVVVVCLSFFLFFVVVCLFCVCF